MNGIVGVYSYIDFVDICLRSTMLMQVMDIVFTYSNIQIFIYDRKVSVSWDVSCESLP